MRAALAVAVVSTLLFGPRVQAAHAQAQGVGEVTFPNSGAPAAQAPFLAGLAQLHNFEYASAADPWTIDSRGGWRTEIALEFGTGYAAAQNGQRAAAGNALDRLARAREALDAALSGNERDGATLEDAPPYEFGLRRLTSRRGSCWANCC